jgi:GNAT superfamily N-acetyltransferase
MGRHTDTKRTLDGHEAGRLSIRAMANRDIRHFSLLFQRIFSQPPWNETWSIAFIHDLAWKIMRRPGYIGTVAEYESRPVGYAIGYELPRVPFIPGFFYLDHLFVDEEYRGIGVGGGLLAKMALLAGIRRMGTMLLMTKKNSPAEALYLDEGFKRLLPFIKIQKKIVLYKKLYRI